MPADPASSAGADDDGGGHAADDPPELVDVFISYSHQDEAIAARLAETLVAEGFSVWFDRAIRAGTAWEHELRAVLANAKAVLVVWSQHSVASRWVRREATIARRTRRLVPVRIDTSELPEGFRSIETALLDGWDGGEDHAELQPLLAGIARLAPPSRIDTVRPGYDSAFLDVEVPLPGVVGVADELRYLHFSVVLNPARRLAWYSAANIARRETAVERPVRWLPDPMVPTAFQPLDEHYRGTGFDRGHLTRSLAVAWGEERMATIARRQAFFFTNTAPQHPDVNQRSWLSVEEWEDALLTIHDRMVSFSGPALFEDDPIHRSVEQMIGRVRVRANFRLPRAFWKVIAVRHDRGQVRTAAMWVDQVSPVDGPRRPRADVSTFRRTVPWLEETLQLDFGDVLRSAEPLDG